ncbi:MAG: metalloregulator ArsR/SmtB family transcription factor [Chloroflexota bacterium]|nr:metalloregulator ArsR/SmtB family transcription factor [Chloroflexota bacterium]
MPAPDPDLIAAPTTSPIRVALEPAQNALNSLLLLDKADKLSGLGEWVTRTAAALTPEQRHNNRLVLYGLYYAVTPDQSWPSFPAYVNHLADQDPTTLRNHVFNAYAQMRRGRRENGEHCLIPDPASGQVPIDIAPLLENVDTFLEFLLEGFPAKSIDPEIESEAHRYLNDPPAMQSLIVSHLRSMWEEVLEPEWERVVPVLQASTDAFQQLNLSNLSKPEAAKLVLGQEPEECWKAEFEQAEKIIFVPSTHVGPYIGQFKFGGTLWILFGARIPEGVQIHAPDLSRAEIIVRINALADDTRLRILRLVSEGGEQCSHDIRTRLELSQSAVSRHLKQLSATGYLNERRCNGAKCYTLNPKRIKDTLRAISLFLLGN